MAWFQFLWPHARATLSKAAQCDSTMPPKRASFRSCAASSFMAAIAAAGVRSGVLASGEVFFHARVELRTCNR